MSIISSTFSSFLKSLGVVGAGTLQPQQTTILTPQIISIEGGTPIGSQTPTTTTPPPTDLIESVLNDPESFTERVQVLERIRNNVEIDPAAKSRILLLASSRPTLTAQDLRTIFAVCLYPSAQGLPSPEGYEYFLSLLEKGKTVTAALADTRVYFKADAALTGTPPDPDAPDTQQQSRVFLIAIIAALFLIIRKL